MNIKDEFLTNGTFLIKDGSVTRFWEDTWIGNICLSRIGIHLFIIL